jgi:hypothetical protein
LGSTAPSIDDVLSAYALQHHQRGMDARERERFAQTIARVLARLALPEDAPLPAALDALARAIVLAPSTARAEALTSELRLAVQRESERMQAREAHAAEARGWLAELPEDAPAALVNAVERVAAGADAIDEPLRRSVQAVLDTAAAEREQEESAAASFVLQESLRDLGYEVDNIEATLFVDGGTVHFSRPGWENYHVRLRVDANEHTVNFNVVRARGDEESAERKRLDTLAEDRWCAEFPRVMQTLAARGLELQVTRRLDAGMVPVQVVDGASLPRRGADDAAGERPPPLARRMPS